MGLTDNNLEAHEITHFVGFRGEEYWSAVKIWGKPTFIHKWWDRRAQREIAEGDIVIFAKGDHAQQIREHPTDDYDERWL